MARRPPRVFTIPAGTPFIDTLARGILESRSGDPLELARVLVLLPTRRACRALHDAFLRATGGRPLLLPAIRPIADVDEEEISVHGIGPGHGISERALGIPPAIPALRRQLLLARLILELDAQRRPHGSDGMDHAQAAALASELASLLDQMQTERLSFSVLEEVVPDQLAAHWRQTLDFLKILTEHWPRLLRAEGCIDPADRRNRLLEMQADVWRSTPPGHPVIAAGSTGTIPATADLLKVIAALPEGTVILPGLDRTMNEETWRAVDETHHQYGLRRLLDHLGVPRFDVPVWEETGGEDRPDGRARFLSEAMRPAETTHAWRSGGHFAPSVVAGLDRIDCPGPEEEARVIALVMREALETPGRTAALVTPDRALARRVAAEVRRWDVEIDDSAGVPLGETPPGAFFRLVARMAAERLAPVPLLAVLKHPLAAGGMARARFRRTVRALERVALRGPRPARDLEGLAAAVEAAGANDTLRSFVARLGSCLSTFLEASRERSVPHVELLECHVAACEALAADERSAGAERMWDGDAGAELAGFVDEFHRAAEGMTPLSGAEYAALLTRLLGGRVVRPRWGLHPRLNIWGLLEARLQRADVMILGGLNEGTWPPEPRSDPWLSRPMREAVGLPTPERRIGLTAHDFVQAAAAPVVFLTRSEKVEGTPAVPSRWLLRIETLLARLGGALESRHPWLRWQESLDRSETGTSPVAPPEPRPPLSARPRHLSVTDVETWVRDPYALFAKRILRLRPLDPVDADPGAMERGIFIHRALEMFLSEHGLELPENAVERLVSLGESAFGAALSRPSVRSFWWPRFQRVADWFIGEMRALIDGGGVARTAVEVRGEIEFKVSGAPFTLVAKADRIDTRSDGSLAIVDYKTGGIPSRKEVASGLSPQLPLEAWMAQAGGFHDVEAASVSELAYWRLSGGSPPGEIVPVREDVAELTERARGGLRRLVDVFDDPAIPYRARPRPRHAIRYGNYDHLARVAEWSARPDGDSE